MSKHTPTPWKVFRTTTGLYLGIGDSEGGGIMAGGVGFWRGGPEADANAEFVCRAVNSHDALVEALRTVPDHSELSGQELHEAMCVWWITVATPALKASGEPE